MTIYVQRDSDELIVKPANRGLKVLQKPVLTYQARGPQGVQGPPWDVLGSVPTSGDLPAGAEIGDAYLVTDPDPDEIWVYGSNGWAFFGYSGVAGPPGDLSRAEADVRYEPRSDLLREAAWWVEAGNATADRLVDLSGNGRDAVFGAGAAAPLVLPWDGEDYLHFPQPYTSSNRLQALSRTLPLAATIIRSRFLVESGGFAGSAVIHYPSSATDGAIRVFVNPSDGTLTIGHCVSAAYQFLYWAGAVVFDEWHDLEVHLDATGVEPILDGVSLGRQDFATPRTLEPVIPGLYSGYQGSYAYMTVEDAATGQMVYGWRAGDVDEGLTAVADVAGGADWGIYRATSGYKTAVVDRPLLLFGGGQYADTEAVLDPGPVTVLAAARCWNSADGSPYDVIVAHASGNTPQGWMLVFREPNDVLHTRTHVTDSTRRLTTDLNHPGHHVYGMRVTDVDTRAFLDGAPMNQVTTPTGLPSVNTGTLTIGALNNGQFPLDMEFLAAAVWDRALTDEEIAEASAALVGTAHPKQPDPHPQYAFRWGEVGSWAALPAVGDHAGQSILVNDPTNVGLLVARWTGAAWVVDPVSDTGWRDISGLLVNPGDWEPADTVRNSVVRRTGNTVRFSHFRLVAATPVNTKHIWTALPGFQPHPTSIPRYRTLGTAIAGGTLATVNDTGANNRIDCSVAGTPAQTVIFEVLWQTDDPWPTTLPGTAV